MNLLSSPRTYTALAAAQAADAVGTAIPIPHIEACLDDVGFPRDKRWILVAVKVSSAVGLASAARYPALARLTTLLLIVYFVFAVSMHVRAKDFGLNFLAASSMLATYAVLAAQGPSRST